MSRTSIALNVVLAFLVFAGAGVVFAWLAWRAAQRWGPRVLLPAWVIGALLCAGLMAARIAQQQTALGFTAAQQSQFSPFVLFLPMWAAGLGAVALVVRRRLRTGRPNFSVGTAMRSLGAFLGGSLAYFLVYAAADIGRVFLRP